MNLNIAIAQFNPTLGDFDANYQKICASWVSLERQGANIILMPELAICGYDPRDLALRDDFQKQNHLYLQKLIEQSQTHQAAIIIGAITNNDSEVYNSAFVIHQGQILHQHNKIALPNYSVFDEKRIYSSGTQATCFNFKDTKLALLICEDIWDQNILHQLAPQSPDAILALNASPFEVGKYNERIQVIKAGQKICKAPVVYCNLVGGQDSLVFDGASFVLDADSHLCFQLKRFAEDSIVFDLSKLSQCAPFKPILEEEIYSCLILALRDYLRKNNMQNVVLGFSGGIDSTLTAMIAIDALGPEKVKLVTLPSRFSSTTTYKDSEDFCHNLNIRAEEISIEPILASILQSLEPNFQKMPIDTTEENIQARIRGLLLMAISNKHGSLLLSTGNKSEMAVGYATLYGDMNGGFNLLKDIYKTQIFALAKWRNNNIPSQSLVKKLNLIPSNIISKAPSAELGYEQKDSDALPEYHVLDSILYQYIELGLSSEDIIAKVNDTETVDKVLKLIKIGEFKRNQSTLGPKISTMSFDLDWRYPITNKFIK